MTEALPRRSMAQVALHPEAYEAGFGPRMEFRLPCQASTQVPTPSLNSVLRLLSQLGTSTLHSTRKHAFQLRSVIPPLSQFGSLNCRIGRTRGLSLCGESKQRIEMLGAGLLDVAR